MLLSRAFIHPFSDTEGTSKPAYSRSHPDTARYKFNFYRLSNVRTIRYYVRSRKLRTRFVWTVGAFTTATRSWKSRTWPGETGHSTTAVCAVRFRKISIAYVMLRRLCCLVNEPHPSSTTLQDIILSFRRAVGIVSLLCWYAKLTDSSPPPRVYVRSFYGSGDSFPRSVFIISVIVLFQKYKFISQVKREEGI